MYDIGRRRNSQLTEGLFRTALPQQPRLLGMVVACHRHFCWTVVPA